QVNYPTVDEEIGVVSETTGVESPELSPVLSGAEVLQFQRLVRAMP
ncbi:MAG TPA: AAA family ATPase, partial [Verrucomicrobiales bacterium]|nr:AAA family ATPase [Verrucomicrobiales bacterium]